MNKIFKMFLPFCSFLLLSVFGYSQDLSFLLSPNVPVNAIPDNLKLPDAVLPDLRKSFNDTIGKQSSGDAQFKIVVLTTKITNVPSQKYSFFEDIVLWDVKSSLKTANKVFAVAPDARVLAISALAASSNSQYVPTVLAVIERDDNLKTRLAAAKVLPSLGGPDMIVPKLIDLLRNQYGASRGKFSEGDQARYDDDKVAQAIIESLGEIGDARAFTVILQTVMSPDTHLDDTVKAGWDAMKKLKW